MMDAQYFIDKFEAIPEERWTTYIQVDTDGRRCALGHMLPSNFENTHDWISNGMKCGSETEEGKILAQMFVPEDIWAGANRIANINNGNNPAYKQGSPRRRILAALRDIQVLEQQNRAVEEAKQVIAQPVELV